MMNLYQHSSSVFIGNLCQHSSYSSQWWISPKSYESIRFLLIKCYSPPWRLSCRYANISAIIIRREMKIYGFLSTSTDTSTIFSHVVAGFFSKISKVTLHSSTACGTDFPLEKQYPCLFLRDILWSCCMRYRSDNQNHPWDDMIICNPLYTLVHGMKTPS